MDNSTIAHQWAHQIDNQDYGSNFFYEGRTIYSYGKHFPIATLHGNLVFITDASYSKTTSRHKSLVISAVSHKERVTVSYLPADTTDIFNNELFQSRNIEHWIKELRLIADDFDRNPKKKSLLNTLNGVLADLNHFVQVMNIEPSGVLKLVLENPTMSALVAYSQAEAKKKTEAEKNQQKLLLRKYNNQLKDWKAGRTSNLHIINPRDIHAYLRYNESKKRIETSKNVQVPLEMARSFWLYIQDALSKGFREFDYTILDYQVDEITAKYIRIGCHTITMTEVNRIAKMLDWRPV